MSLPLPVFIKPFDFATQGIMLEGSVEVSGLSRLADILADDSGAVNIDFSFAKEGALSTLQGSVKANLMLQCQSCLQPVVCSVDRRFKLGLVASLAQADRLTDDCEPLILKTEKILLSDLIEDELLLALPDFPRHKDRCITNLKESTAIVKNDCDKPLNSHNPFSLLATLKNIGDS